MRPVLKRILPILLIFILVVLGSGYFIYRSYARLNEELVRRTSLLLGKAVEDALRNGADRNLQRLTRTEKKRLRSLMNSMTTETGSIIHILLINSDMKILLSSDRSIEGQQYKSAQELQNLRSTRPLVLNKTWQGGLKVLDVIIPLKNANQKVFGYLRLILSRKELADFYGDLSVIFLPIVLLFSLLLIFTFYFVSRSYRSPLESLRTMASRLDKGDYSYRIHYDQKDEFTDTFSRLNKTIEKVSVLSEGYKKAEKRISTLLRAVDQSIVILDYEGRVSAYNESALHFFHCPQNNDFMMFFQTILSRNRELQTLINRARESGRSITDKEVTIWLEKSRDVLARVTCQIYKEGQNIVNILLSFKDAHLLDELQSNLQRSMKFGVIANLASSISHEIKNPLSAMAIHTEILSNRMRKIHMEDAEKLQKSLDILQNEVKRLNRITQQFFSLARVKRTDLTLIQINGVIKDVLALVKQQAIERNIKIESELEANLDFIYGDADQLKQVILNLVINAFQAIGQKGTVYLRTHSSERRIMVEIQDTGKGMSEEVQQHIFDLYFSTKEDGGGIGLAVSKNIMQVHEGRISFESAPGQGTKFILDFPRKDKTTQLNIPVVEQD